MYSPGDIADVVEAGLAAEAGRLDLEQAVFGLDVLDEVALHPIIRAALSAGGFGVHPEQRYPRDRIHPSRAEGERCDIVLTPEGRPLNQPDAEATLFEPADAVALSDAYWLEIKVVAQFSPEGPNARYAVEMMEPVRRDVGKLARDPEILHAGVLLVIFNDEVRTADHDLGIWQSRCISRGLPIGAPSLRRIPISNRIGNGVCTIALYPVHHL